MTRSTRGGRHLPKRGTRRNLTAQLLARIHETTIRDTLSLARRSRRCVKRFKGCFPDGSTCGCLDESKPVLVEIGHDRLEYLLLHLIANARDAMPKEGRVDIAVEVVSGELLPPSSWKESAQAHGQDRGERQRRG